MRVFHGIALAALLAAVPAAAMDLPISTVASFGPSPSAGIGAKSFGTGRTFALEAAWHPERSTGWMLRAGRTDLSRDAGVDATSLLLSGGGQLYVPPATSREVGVDVSFLQLGMRRSRAIGRVRPFVEAAVGASVVRDAESRVEGALVNDRRAAWTASGPGSAGYETTVAPSFGLGLGAVSVLPGRVALLTSFGAEFTALRGLVGAQLPVRFGATWPAAMPAGPVADAGRSPRFRASAGLGALHSPARISGGLGGGHSFAGEVELPMSEHFALSLAGEHDTRETRETYYRQHVSNSGTTEFVPAGSVEAAFAATVATLGARIRLPIGRAAFSLRSGFGFGRTSGFGTTVQSVNGAYLDANGQWIPAIDLATVGGGAAANGWAWAAAAGAEVRVTPAVRAFVESGLTSIELHGEHVRSTPLRLGLALN